MRTRLLLVLLAFSLTAIAGFLTPLLVSTADARTNQLVIARTAELDHFAALAEAAHASGDDRQLDEEVRRYSDLYGEGLLVVDARRRTVVSSGGLRPTDHGLADLVDGALRNQPAGPAPTIMPWSQANLVLARPVGSDTQVVGAVVLSASVQAAAADLAGQWAVILAGAFVAAVACSLLAVVVARWLLRPLRELAHGMRAVTDGRRGAHVPVGSGPPELRTLASAFNTMSDAVADSVDQQRRLIADASHQLRNPMAALRLRIDGLATQIDSRGERSYQGAVAEVERLETLLDGLMALAMAEHNAALKATQQATEQATANKADDTEPSHPMAVVLDRVDAWRPAALESDVRLHAPDVTDCQQGAACPDAELAQALDVLLDNAIKYAGPGADVTVDCGHDDGALVVTVADTGPGLSADERRQATHRFWRGHHAQRGTGLGLAIADRIVATHGGRLTLGAAQPHGLVVRIEFPSSNGIAL